LQKAEVINSIKAKKCKDVVFLFIIQNCIIELHMAFCMDVLLFSCDCILYRNVSVLMPGNWKVI
jgi:hypothetical protein